MIHKVRISNFKTFDEFELELKPFNVIIGPNASGKTNFIDVFRFLQNSLIFGVDDAVAKRTGWKNVRCIAQQPESQVSSFIFEGISRDSFQTSSGNNDNDVRRVEVVRPGYKFEFKFQPDNPEEFEHTIIHEVAEIWPSKTTDESQLSSWFKRNHEIVRFHEETSQHRIEFPDLPVTSRTRSQLFLGAQFFPLASVVVNQEIIGWRFYDPNPEAARSTPLHRPGTVSMSESGDTLALVLHNLEKETTTEADKVRLEEFMQSLVPGFENWETQKLQDGRIRFEIKEKNFSTKLPPDSISDGTIRLLTILASLIRIEEFASVVFIEEPERGLHPWVLEELVGIMREVSENVQIIVTTHSPDFVRACNPSDVVLMDKVNGFTKAKRADTIDHIEYFLERFTLDELWTQGHLELGIPR